ncbi:MAG: hypothetical protein U0T82_11580 [Bacteroidales bacterium]
MRKQKLFQAVLMAGLFLILSTSCEKEGGGNETNISNSSATSHHAGDNCMSCHKSGGSGEGWFLVAGTAYNTAGTSVFANAKVYLYSEKANESSLVKTITADKSGNFYTTSSIDFGNGLYVAVENSTGTKSYMNSPVSSGACNSCHSKGSRITAP